VKQVAAATGLAVEQVKVRLLTKSELFCGGGGGKVLLPMLKSTRYIKLLLCYLRKDITLVSATASCMRTRLRSRLPKGCSILRENSQPELPSQGCENFVLDLAARTFHTPRELKRRTPGNSSKGPPTAAHVTRVRIPRRREAF